MTNFDNAVPPVSVGAISAGANNAEPGNAELGAWEVRRRRLLFRATHRGTFENDLMVGGFVRAHYDSLTDADLDALDAVMEIPDDLLAEWLTGRCPIPPEQETAMLQRMRAFLQR